MTYPAFPKTIRTRREGHIWSKVEEACGNLWSRIVRKRDGYQCQWCGGKDLPAGHHIVQRSLSNVAGHYDPDNGVTLCNDCHIYRLNSDPLGYLSWRDEWLAKRGLSFESLRKKYSIREKVSLDELKAIHENLKQAARI
jgi:5-methylcytosine-specific restriction endonuclease McrA